MRGTATAEETFAVNRARARIAVVLVEQYLDFARELGDHFVVMDRGAIVHACSRADMDEGALKRALAI